MFWTFRLLKRKNKEENEWVRDKPYEWAVALAAAKTEDDVTRALDSAFSHVQNELKPLILLIFQALREPDFPKRQEKQLDFLADSLSARGQVSPRRSRDICAETRAIERAKSRHRIVRREYYVECSCGYKGPARDNACRKCGAAIELALDDLMERGLV
jgi:hypothetical protein